VQRALDVIDGRWTLLILRDLMNGTRRFGELRRSLADLNPKTLSERLRHLEKHGILSRRVFGEIPPRVEYTLTEKGRSLQQVISALGAWGKDWTNTPPATDEAAASPARFEVEAIGVLQPSPSRQHIAREGKSSSRQGMSLSGRSAVAIKT
jgi:DNA-binding HxlR family transcriptional regulator